MADSIYCYKNTSILKNKFNIINPEKLNQVERELTSIRVYDLIRKPIKGNFDFKHLCAIHFYIFQDIYEWAGVPRKTNIAKANMFCNVMFLYEQAEEVFGAIKDDNYLRGLPYDEFVKRLVFHFSNINALHPFREGNGRSQREFIRELALYNDYVINFSLASEEEMLNASIDSFLCKYEKMEVLFKKCLWPIK